MKRVGILTFHRYYNYGTALQAYALQKFISKNYGCDVELIDYLAKNEYVGKKLLTTRIKRLPTYIKNAKKYIVLQKNKKNLYIKNSEFNDFFRNFMVLSSENADSVEQLEQICKRYDAVMVGSDQTWNPCVSTRGEFLLEFLNAKEVSKLSYAPSIGLSKIPKEYQSRYKNALNDFDALSCREYGGASFLSELLGKNVEFVLDPTLLLTPNDWEEISADIDVEEPYLLTYFLGDNQRHRKIAGKIAKEKNLRIVALPVSYFDMCNKAIEKQYVGPAKFVSLINKASFICTDSFHGTMFSINFNKNFLSFVKRNDADINSDNNRIYDALRVFGLTNRLFRGEMPASLDIDYTAINARIRELRLTSYNYLGKVLTDLSNT